MMDCEPPFFLNLLPMVDDRCMEVFNVCGKVIDHAKTVGTKSKDDRKEWSRHRRLWSSHIAFMGKTHIWGQFLWFSTAKRRHWSQLRWPLHHTGNEPLAAKETPWHLKWLAGPCLLKNISSGPSAMTLLARMSLGQIMIYQRFSWLMLELLLNAQKNMTRLATVVIFLIF